MKLMICTINPEVPKKKKNPILIFPVFIQPSSVLIWCCNQHLAAAVIGNNLFSFLTGVGLSQLAHSQRVDNGLISLYFGLHTCLSTLLAFKHEPGFILSDCDSSAVVQGQVTDTELLSLPCWFNPAPVCYAKLQEGLFDTEVYVCGWCVCVVCVHRGLGVSVNDIYIYIYI